MPARNRSTREAVSGQPDLAQRRGDPGRMAGVHPAGNGDRQAADRRLPLTPRDHRPQVLRRHHSGGTDTWRWALDCLSITD
jgi:hypothetical protein